MKPYTIIGYYDDTGLAYFGFQRAEDPYQAMRQAATETPTPTTLCIVCAIEGTHVPDSPGEDNLSTAFASDLIDDDDKCDECGEPNNDGEGYDGLCGNCADKKEPNDER